MKNFVLDMLKFKLIKSTKWPNEHDPEKSLSSPYFRFP